MYSCVQTTSPSLSTKVDVSGRPIAWYLLSRSLRNANESARLGIRTSIGPDTPPAYRIRPSALSAVELGAVGSAAATRSFVFEHPALTAITIAMTLGTMARRYNMRSPITAQAADR